MNMGFRWLGTVLCVGAITGTAMAQVKPGRLDEVIRQLDASSAKFQSAEADFRWDLYERVVKQTSTQTGTIYFIRKGSSTEMGAQIVPPGAKTLEFKDGKLRVFDPMSNHLIEIAAGKNSAQYESFLTLGFGGSGTALTKAWTITDLGTESMSDGAQTVSVEKLDLVAKEQSVRNMFTHIVIWVDPLRDVSLKQQFFTPSEDVRTAVYTKIRYNTKVDTKPFAIKTDKQTTVDRR